MTTVIKKLPQLTPALREQIAEMAADGWDQPEGRFDWESFLNRVERQLDIELPINMVDPVISAVMRTARTAAREAKA